MKASANSPLRSARRRMRRPRQLGLSARGGRGGYRAGAGRKAIPRDARGYVPHTTRPRVTRSTPVHVTLRCVEGLPSLRRPTHRRIIEGVFARESRRGFRLVHYAILGNHMHLIVEGRDTAAVSRGLQRIASAIARRLNRRFGRRGRFFRERFDGNVLRSPRQVRHALRYVLLNHHKHQLQAHGEMLEGFDPCSSGRYFDGWRRPTESRHPPPARGAPVVAPQSWLLRVGWRRHGLLEPRWV